MKKLTFLLVTLLLIVNVYSSEFIRILHINDLHGHLLQKADSEGHQSGGISPIAAKMNNIKSLHPDTIILDAGDFISGYLYANFDKGQTVLDIYKHVPFSALVVGNHELDYGFNYMLDVLEPISDKMITANVYQNEEHFYQPYIIRESGDLRVLIFGITTPDIERYTPGLEDIGVNVTQPVEEARRVISQNSDKADIFVMLSHCGFENDKELARQLPELDIIIGGHTHTLVKVPPVINNTIVTQAGSYGERLGYLRAAYEKDSEENYNLKYFRSSMMEPKEIWGSVAEIDKITTEAKQKVIEMSEDIIGEAVSEFGASRGHVRGNENALGNLITDALKDELQTDIAIMNAGGIRASVSAGPISYADIESVLPFSNDCIAIRIKGNYLQQVFENSMQALLDPALSGGFLQVSGIKVEYNLGAEKVDLYESSGALISPEKEYTLALNDYILYGGDGYDFGEFEIIELDGPVEELKDVVARYISQKVRVEPKTYDRIIINE
ncbi:MAG: bifunctional metallophosphatase/5'-nucleotidase [Candidatus Muiribacteriota bacterium]